MKKLFTFILLLFSHLIIADYWLQKTDFGGTPRSDATAFSIGSKGYLGTGFTSTGYSKDWWEYDPATNAWTQKADFGGSPVVESTSFVISNYGYVLSSPANADFWQYDPMANFWNLKATFPGGARQAAVAFSINGKGYITTGFGIAALDDLWEYDPVSDTWAQKSSMQGVARYYAAGFSIGGKGYLGTGQSAATIGLNDFWEWDQASDAWTQKANVPGAGRREACGFAIGNFGYLGMGSGIGAFYLDFFQYDPSLNTWTPKANFGGGQREETAQFSLGNFGYVGTGYNGMTAGVSEKDLWEYHPEDSTTGIAENTIYNMQLSVFPNPASQDAVIGWSRLRSGAENNNIVITISDMNGNIYFTKQMHAHKQQLTLDINKYSAGIYFVEASDGKHNVVKKFIKE